MRMIPITDVNHNSSDKKIRWVNVDHIVYVTEEICTDTYHGKTVKITKIVLTHESNTGFLLFCYESAAEIVNMIEQSDAIPSYQTLSISAPAGEPEKIVRV